MIPSRRRVKLSEFILLLFLGGAAALNLLTVVPSRCAQNPDAPANVETPATPLKVNDQAAVIAPPQKEEPKKANRDNTKTDAAELSALADQLRDELNKMNVNVLSLAVVQRTEAIEKLAKKIKGEAHGH